MIVVFRGGPRRAPRTRAGEGTVSMDDDDAKAAPRLGRPFPPLHCLSECSRCTRSRECRRSQMVGQGAHRRATAVREATPVWAKGRPTWRCKQWAAPLHPQVRLDAPLEESGHGCYCKLRRFPPSAWEGFGSPVPHQLPLPEWTGHQSQLGASEVQPSPKAHSRLVSSGSATRAGGTVTTVLQPGTSQWISIPRLEINTPRAYGQCLGEPAAGPTRSTGTRPRKLLTELQVVEGVT